MPIEIVNLKKGKPNITSFVEKSWNSLTEFNEYVKNVDENQSKSSNLSSTRSLRSSKKRKRLASILNVSNADRSAIHSNKSPNVSNTEKETFIIEDVNSDEEPAPKRVGTRASNRIKNSKKKSQSLTPTKSKNCKELVSLIENVTPIKQCKKAEDLPVELSCSQKISQVDSPHKGEQSGAIESRCFLKVSKKVEKLINNHNLAKLYESKHTEIKQQKMTYDLVETIHKKLEERKTWLSLNKQDQVERESLFLKMTKVNEPRNGLLDCECKIDFDRMKEVIVFKNPKLKTMIPKYYSDQLEISRDAILEYVGPWNVFDIDDLQISYIINPFWIHILDNGISDSVQETWETVYRNPNLV